MIEDSILHIPDGNYKILKLDLRAYKNKKPDAPVQKMETYDDGLGDTATQNGVNFSDYNKNQAQRAQTNINYFQNKLYDTNGADTQAQDYAQNQYNNGLKRFTKSANDLYGSYLADTANRFGSLDNSTYDSGMKRFGQATQEGLQDLSNNYDTNYYDRLKQYNDYYGSLLGSNEDALNNIYGLGNALSGYALNSSNGTNNFNQNNYAQQVSMWNAQKTANAGLWGNIANATGKVVGGNKWTGISGQ